MSNSEKYREVKKAIHEDDLSIESVHIHMSNRNNTQSGEIKFEDGKVIEGSEDDFIMLLFELKSTVREGNNEIIDLSATNLDNSEEYYSNIDVFLPDDQDFISGDKGAIEVGLEALHSQDADEPQEIGLLEALDASVELSMENEELVKVIENYHEALALQWIHIAEAYEGLKEIKSDFPHDQSRFESYLDQTNNILQEVYLAESPLVCYRRYRESTIIDSMFLLEQMGEVRNKTHEEWKALAGEDGGTIEGELAIPRLLQDYANHFELARDPLRDLAASLDYKNGFENVELDDTSDVIQFLKREGYQNLVGTIIPDLRHGPAHMCIDINDDEGIVSIYDGRGRDRKKTNEFGISTLDKKLKKFRDLVAAMVISFAIVEQLIIFRYLDSEDFMFRVIENIDPDNLSDNSFGS